MSGDNFEIMVDLETLDTEDSAAIVSIGACKFKPFDAGFGPENDIFYAVVDLECKDSVKRTISGSTVRWWIKQSKEAQEPFSLQGLSLEQVLYNFKNWCEGPRPIWSNGDSFDNAILKHAYENSIWKEPPFEFWMRRDVRTVMTVADELNIPLHKFDGIQHNALRDAIHQAKNVTRVLYSVKGKWG